MREISQLGARVASAAAAARRGYGAERDPKIGAVAAKGRMTHTAQTLNSAVDAIEPAG